MTRKRITVQDLIDFNSRMDELSGIVEEKYNAMDAVKAVKLPEFKTNGVLLLKKDEALIRKLNRENFTYVVYDLDRSIKTSDNKVTPAWNKVITALNAACESVNAENVYICAPEEMLLAGLLLAAQYDVKAVFTENGVLKLRIPSLFGKARILSKINSVAKKNLFQVTVPVFAGGMNSSLVKAFLDKHLRSDTIETFEGTLAERIIELIRQISIV